MSISSRFTPENPTIASWVYTKLVRRTGNKWLLGPKSEFLTFILLVSKYVYMGLSENRGYPQIAILMGNMVIIHWNMRYTIFRQTHILYTQHTMLSILAAAHGGAGHGLEPSRPGSESVQRRAGWCIARSGSITNHHILQL